MIASTNDAFISVTLDDEEQKRASSVAQMRCRTIPEEAKMEKQIVGAYAEIAVAQLLSSRGFTVDHAYESASRLGEADIYVNAHGIDVKARGSHLWDVQGPRFPECQKQKLARLHSVFWCRVVQHDDGKWGEADWSQARQLGEIHLMGWSSPEDIAGSEIRDFPKTQNDEGGRFYVIDRDAIRPTKEWLERLVSESIAT